MKKGIAVIMCCIMLVFSAACGNVDTDAVQNSTDTDAVQKRTEDIVVLFTGDVHCGIDENIGYSGLEAYKRSVSESTPYLTLVDCGDAVQGSYMGTVSKGELPIEIMNAMGYDLAILGNHEFDYGMERLTELLETANAEYLCCNAAYTGSGETPLSLTKPYEILTYGDTKVAYIGVITPTSIYESTPANFMEDGEYVYDFCGESGEQFYGAVQENIDACREEGADYVVLLTHVGVFESSSPFTSYELAQNTTGVDVILDAHSHTEIPTRVEQNPNGEDVLIAQTGTKLENIGQLVISPSGFISVGYISDYARKDAEMDAVIETVSADVEELMNTVVATLDHDMKITDESGIRIVRSRETAIGDMVADAYRFAANADIGYANGGGVRADLLAGDITYSDLIDVNPFGNSICSVEVTGQEVLDMLEYFYRYTQAEYEQNGEAYGEDGSFGQFSGLCCTVHTDIPTSVVTDSEDMLVEVGETRRVSDVMVLENGEYVPIDPDAAYTFAAADYVIKNGGCGMGLLMAEHNIVLDGIGTDYQILTDFVKSLENDFSAYAEPAGRVTVAE